MKPGKIIRSDLVRDNCTVKAEEDAGEDSQKNAAENDEGPEKNGQTGNGHAGSLAERSLSADQVVEKSLPAFEKQVGALHNSNHGVHWEIHQESSDTHDDACRHVAESITT